MVMQLINLHHGLCCSYIYISIHADEGSLNACRYGLCDMSDAHTWISRAAARCHDCVSLHDLCAHPPVLKIHMYLSYLDTINPTANLIAIKAYLLTQNAFLAMDR